MVRKFVKVSETVLGEEMTSQTYVMQYPLADLKERLAQAQSQLEEVQNRIAWLNELIFEAEKLGIKEVM